MLCLVPPIFQNSQLSRLVYLERGFQKYSEKISPQTQQNFHRAALLEKGEHMLTLYLMAQENAEPIDRYSNKSSFK